MSDERIPILVFVLVSIIASCGINIYLKKSIPFATILSALTTTLVFQLIGSIVMGYLDPFFPIALILGWLYALPIGFITSTIFYAKRNLNDKTKN